jgi:hypothetical protein
MDKQNMNPIIDLLKVEFGVAVHGVRGSVYTTAGTAEKETP